ncbi:MAG: PorP/SprF family type IX secretion system membrane protein [Ekhidna sp.]|nr:PorP/SprF family type IX secretion system membrane protein [Ekhidna sp.]
MRALLTTILLWSTIYLFGQEGQFSQYFASSAVLNPAFIGINPNVSFNTNYKRSGSRSSEAFLKLMQATVSYPFKRSTSRDFQTGAVGVTFWKESRGFEGIYSAQKVLLTGAYAIKLSRLSNQTVVFGLQGGFVQNQINGNNLQWGSQFSRYIGFDNIRDGETVSIEAFFYPAFNFGVIYSNFDNTNYYVRDRSVQLGASVDYLNEPGLEQEELGIAQRNMILRAFGSASFDLAPKVSIYPSGYFLFSDGNQQINTGLYLSTLVSAPRAFNAVVLQVGSWYRVNDAFVLLAGMKINEIRIGMSVDLNASSFDINEALGNTLPSYELSLTYNFSPSQSFQNVSSPIF